MNRKIILPAILMAIIAGICMSCSSKLISTASLWDARSETPAIAPDKFQRIDNDGNTGKSDDMITESATYAPQKLTVEELLYAATMVNAPAIKENIYKKAATIYPSDFRAFNNIGVLNYKAGKIAEAEASFNQALSLSAGAPEVNFNLGLIALTKGETEKAEQFFGKASGVGELNNALGLLAITNGKYDQAVGYYGNTLSNNAALSQILSKDYSKALSTLNAIKKPDALTFYLKAIIGARTKHLNDVVNHLTQAISLDSSLAEKAATDSEFAKYFKNQNFFDLIK